MEYYLNVINKNKCNGDRKGFVNQPKFYLHMKTFTALLIVIMLTACSKSGKNSDLPICPISPASLKWLNEKKAEYSSCFCLTGIRQGIYKNEPVIEIYLFDPLCDGINMVYKTDGTVLFNSSDAIYQDYRANVKDEQVIWTCARQ